MIVMVIMMVNINMMKILLLLSKCDQYHTNGN